MRQSLAKAVRRDVRRSVGEEALNVIDQQSAGIESTRGLIAEHATVLTTHMHQLSSHGRQLDAIDARLDEYGLAVQEWTAFKRLPFLSRLRWLVTGR